MKLRLCETKAFHQWYAVSTRQSYKHGEVVNCSLPVDQWHPFAYWLVVCRRTLSAVVGHLARLVLALIRHAVGCEVIDCCRRPAPTVISCQKLRNTTLAMPWRLLATLKT